VFLRAESKAVHIDTLIRVAGVGLVRLNPREVRTFTLREAVLAVKLELSSDDRVLAPAVHVQRGLRKHEGTSIRDTRVILVGTRLSKGSSNISRETSGVQLDSITTKVGLIVGVAGSVPVSSETSRRDIIQSTRILEKTTGINVSTRISSYRSGTSEGMDSIGKSIDGISGVEGLSTKHLEKEGIASQGRAVVNVLIGLYNPDELLHGVVEVKLDLVGRRTNRLITSELELSNQVLMGVLGHSAALISVQEHVINVQRGSD
jgi:hypothetical protein